MTVAENKRRIHDEYDWFDANRDKIIKNHHGEWAAIRDHRVWGYFPNEDAGGSYMENEQGIEFGDYNLQPCITAEEERANFFSVLPLPGGRNVRKLV